MHLRIVHRTAYTYDEPVKYSAQALCLTPRREAQQRVLNWSIHAPGRRTEQLDAHGNVTHLMTLEEPHRQIEILVSGCVEMAGEVALTPHEGALSPLAYLASTPLTAPDDSIRELAQFRDAIDQGDARPSLMNAPNLFECARCVGEMLRDLHRRDAAALKEFGVDFNASFILGGQIRGEAPRLFSIYNAGNFIEATSETTYFQIGESKYGKPIIDRVLRRTSSLNEAVKCALVSMDSTIRSNLSVGLPLDLVIVKRDRLGVARHISIDAENDYFRGLRSLWSEALREAFSQLPEPDWLSSVARDG